ncbi:MAG: M13 family metallopeptidase [Reichenbachiella sp.]|uniref:M13 family metallopeptidase n=1 Tax=Reichenbachiella sp. TaxID=2184521 RepID=UPI003298F739
MKKIIYTFLAFGTLVSCSNQNQSDELSTRQYVDVAGLDPNTKPGDNFFNHVNGLWHDTTRIADDQSGVGSYRFLNIPQKMLLQDILEELSSGEFSKGSNEQLIGDFYASGMDISRINQLGFEPIKPHLEKIEKIENVSGLMSFVASELKASVYSIISLGIYPDQANSKINIAHFGQTGLGLPDRDYYFKTDSSSVAIQQAYQKYVQTLFELVGYENAPSQAKTVYEIQKQLAASHKTRIERRDVQANYNKLSLTSIEERQPNIGWTSLFNTLGLAADSIDMRQPAYYDQLNVMLKSVALEDWKTYLRADILVSNASVLSEDFEKAEFEYTKVLSGQSKQKSRAERMVQMVDWRLGYALGQVYVNRHFNEEAKKRALELVNNLQKAFEIRIDQLDWMSDSTKLKAKEKLYAITKKIGYPDVWREYKGIEIDKSKFFENVVELRKEQFRFELAKLNQAPNKEEWRTTPSTVTAYYNPPVNEIVFPAGILQYPYFDLHADDAINYGGIGMVIGHELTHAFDDQGAQYDKDGNVKNWWTEEDYKRFRERTQKMIDLYSTFKVLDTVAIKGALTVGENTADNGGIAIAYDAFKMTAQGQDTTRIDGFTPDQRFFLSVARIWRVKMRDEFLRNYVAVDSHSPAMWRVNGPLMNADAFYEAFDVKPEDKNYKSKSDRVVIW